MERVLLWVPSALDHVLDALQYAEPVPAVLWYYTISSRAVHLLFMHSVRNCGAACMDTVAGIVPADGRAATPQLELHARNLHLSTQCGTV